MVLVRTDTLEEHVSYIFRVERVSELGTVLAVTSNWSTLQRNTNCMRMESIRVGYLRYRWRKGDLAYVED
jgi:hypothetical protein